MAAATDPNSQYLNAQLAASTARPQLQTVPNTPKNTFSQKTTTPANQIPLSSTGANDLSQQLANQNTAAPSNSMPGTTPVNGVANPGSSSADPLSSTLYQPSSSSGAGTGAWWQTTGTSNTNSPSGAVNANAAGTAAALNPTGATTTGNPYAPVNANPSQYSAHLGSDPYLNAALANLTGVANGTNVPYTQQVQANMLSGASDMNAAAETSQAQMLRSQQAVNGGSLSDPSSQAAMRQLAASRQGQNATAQQNISMTADQANFAAEQAANNSIAQTRIGEAQTDPMGIGQANNGGQAIPTGNGTTGTGTNTGTTTGTGVSVNTGGVPVPTYNPSYAPATNNLTQNSVGQGTPGAGGSTAAPAAPAAPTTTSTGFAATGNNTAGQNANFSANSASLQQQLGSSMTSQSYLQNPNAYNAAAQAMINFNASPQGQAAQAATQAASAASVGASRGNTPTAAQWAAMSGTQVIQNQQNGIMPPPGFTLSAAQSAQLGRPYTPPPAGFVPIQSGPAKS